MNKLFGSLLLLASALSGCQRAPSTALSPDEARSLLTERNWIDKLPANESDKLHVYRFVPSMGGGVFQDRTLFAGQFELFNFENTGDEIHFYLRHTHEEVTSRYRIETLSKDEQRGPLDLKLTIEKDPRGPSVYFGSRREQAHLGLGLDQDLDALLAR